MLNLPKGSHIVNNVLAKRQPFEAAAKPAYFSGLTKAEGRVLEFVLKGASNKEIATKLHLRECTVKFHMTSLMRTFGVTGRAALVSKIKNDVNAQITCLLSDLILLYSNPNKIASRDEWALVKRARKLLSSL